MLSEYQQAIKTGMNSPQESKKLS